MLRFKLWHLMTLVAIICIGTQALISHSYVNAVVTITGTTCSSPGYYQLNFDVNDGTPDNPITGVALEHFGYSSLFQQNVTEYNYFQLTDFSFPIRYRARHFLWIAAQSPQDVLGSKLDTVMMFGRRSDWQNEIGNIWN